MRKKVILDWEEGTGMVYDANDLYVGCNLSLKSFTDDVDGQRNATIDDLVKLRNAGFTTEEIIELRRKDLI